MPTLLVTDKRHDRGRSLGDLAAEWIEFHYVHGVGDIAGEPYQLDEDFYAHLVDAYALDEDGRRLYTKVVLSRPKGTAKSEIAAAIDLFEAAGPARFAGWAEGGEVFEDPRTGFVYEYEPGEPMGRAVKHARIRQLATAEGQVGETYDNISVNLSGSETDDVSDWTPLWTAWRNLPGFLCGVKETHLPNGAKIAPSATGAKSKDGGKDTKTTADEIHLYTLPALVEMVNVIVRNLVKRRAAEGWLHATTTMHLRGEGSLGETMYKAALAAKETTGYTTDGTLYDHREGFAVEDFDNDEEVLAALREAYANRPWVNYEGMLANLRAPGTDLEDFRRYFLNQEATSSNAFLASDEVARAHILADGSAVRPLAPGDAITMGLDFAPGTQARGSKRLPDSTALIACRLDDLSLHILDLQEAPVNALKVGWNPSMHQLDKAVDDAFSRFRVVGFYSDPAHVGSQLDTWAVKYGAKVKVRASREKPFHRWMSGGQTSAFSRTLDSFYADLLEGRAHIFEDLRLIRHFLNARRVVGGRFGWTLGKENPESAKKIDAAVAGVLAYAAASDALAAGITGAPPKRRAPRRLR